MPPSVHLLGSHLAIEATKSDRHRSANMQAWYVILTGSGHDQFWSPACAKRSEISGVFASFHGHWTAAIFITVLK